MYLTSVNLNNYKNVLKNGGSKSYAQANTVQNTKSDSFIKTSVPSFKGYEVDKKKFSILGESDSYLEELAEVFYQKADKDIEQACKTRYRNVVVDFFKESGKEKYKLAYKKFMPHIKNVRDYSQKVEKNIAALTELALKGDSNIENQQENISKTLFASLKAEQAGKKISGNNGILIYGNASNSDKDEFINWIKNNVPANFEEAVYDDTAQHEFLDNILAKVEKAEENYKDTGERTVLYVKGIDKLFTDDENLENTRIRTEFNQLVESCSEKYHTTLLMQTTGDFDNIDKESIDARKFVTLDLSDGIKPKQKVELAKLHEEKERLENASSKANDYFWYSYDDDSSSSGSGEYVEGGTWGDFCDYWKYS